MPHNASAAAPGFAQSAWTGLKAYSSTWDTTFGDDRPDVFIYLGVTYVIFLAAYWCIGTLLLPLDFWADLRDWARPVKCQPHKRMTLGQVKEIACNVAIQHVTVYVFGLVASYGVLRRRISIAAELPSWSTIAWQVPVFLFATELWFYYVHRALHHKSVYRYIHKFHHRFTSPIALEALYFHPIESLLNFGVVAAGPLIVGAHITMLWFWLVVSTVGILLHHSGYEIPFDDMGFGSMTQLHDFHHAKYSTVFGVLGLMDRIHGTDQGFKEHMAEWKKQREPGNETWDTGSTNARKGGVLGEGGDSSSGGVKSKATVHTKAD